MNGDKKLRGSGSAVRCAKMLERHPLLWLRLHLPNVLFATSEKELGSHFDSFEEAFFNSILKESRWASFA